MRSGAVQPGEEKAQGVLIKPNARVEKTETESSWEFMVIIQEAMDARWNMGCSS